MDYPERYLQPQLLRVDEERDCNSLWHCSSEKTQLRTEADA